MLDPNTIPLILARNFTLLAIIPARVSSTSLIGTQEVIEQQVPTDVSINARNKDNVVALEVEGNPTIFHRYSDNKPDLLQKSA